VPPRRQSAAPSNVLGPPGAPSKPWPRSVDFALHPGLAACLDAASRTAPHPIPVPRNAGRWRVRLSLQHPNWPLLEPHSDPGLVDVKSMRVAAHALTLAPCSASRQYGAVPSCSTQHALDGRQTCFQSAACCPHRQVPNKIHLHPVRDLACLSAPFLSLRGCASWRMVTPR
jgi:hypothetical protein